MIWTAFGIVLIAKQSLSGVLKMKLEKGFYVIGRDKENSKSYILGSEFKRFDTCEEAEEEKSIAEDESIFGGVETDIQILEVE